MVIGYILSIYFVVGLAFSIWFAFFKVKRIDEAAAGTSIGFKLIIMPAAVILWPLLFLKLAYKK